MASTRLQRRAGKPFEQGVTLLALFLVFVSSSCGGHSDGDKPEPSVPSTFGFHIVDWSGEDSILTEAKQAMEALQRSGGRAVSLVTYRFVDPETGALSTTSAFGLRPPPTDEVLSELAGFAKGLGLQLGLTPLVEVDNPEGIGRVWRGDFLPLGATLERFSKDYIAYLETMAALAGSAPADLLCVGSELKALMRNPTFSKVMDELAVSLRKTLPETKLLYAAHFDKYDSLNNWKSVDLIGVNLYEGLVSREEALGQEKPTSASLAEALEAKLRRLRSFSLRMGKPAVITEWGFVPYDLTTVEPWSWQPSTEPDSQEQKDALLAMVEASKNRGSWLHSSWLWHLSLPGTRESPYAVALDSELGVELIERLP